VDAEPSVSGPIVDCKLYPVSDVLEPPTSGALSALVVYTMKFATGGLAFPLTCTVTGTANVPDIPATLTVPLLRAAVFDAPSDSKVKTVSVVSEKVKDESVNATDAVDPVGVMAPLPTPWNVTVTGVFCGVPEVAENVRPYTRLSEKLPKLVGTVGLALPT
jgi:hypothetical protein